MELWIWISTSSSVYFVLGTKKDTQPSIIGMFVEQQSEIQVKTSVCHKWQYMGLYRIMVQFITLLRNTIGTDWNSYWNRLKFILQNPMVWNLET